MIISNVQATFIISDISFNDVYEKYMEGHYNNLSLTEIKDKRPKIVSKIKKKEVVEENVDKERYVISDNRGIKITFMNVMGPCNICQWCRKPIKDNKISIPMSINRSEDNKDTTFNGYGTYCTFECAYADLNKTYRNNIKFRDSSMYMNFIFTRIYPDKILKQAPDFILHQCNGGPLTDLEFHSNTHVYHNTGKYKINDTLSTYIVR
jgi:hypothetical protein